jgi:predicted nucleotide-binding protein
MDRLAQDRALGLLRRQDEALANLSEGQLPVLLPLWKARTIRLLKDLIVEDELRLLDGISSESWTGDKLLLGQFIRELQGSITEFPNEYLIQDQLSSNTKPPEMVVGSQNTSLPISNKVFVVHGHDSLAKIDVARTLEKLGLEAIVLHEQPNEGKTIIEKFERDASKVSFAVIVLSPDDIGYAKDKPDDKAPRARQNVVLELGFFCGALGRSRVCVLFKGSVETPSDYLGVVYIPMDDAGSWRFGLGRELKQANLPVDLNELI